MCRKIIKFWESVKRKFLHSDILMRLNPLIIKISLDTRDPWKWIYLIKIISINRDISVLFRYISKRISLAAWITTFSVKTNRKYSIKKMSNNDFQNRYWCSIQLYQTKKLPKFITTKVINSYRSQKLFLTFSVLIIFPHCWNSTVNDIYYSLNLSLLTVGRIRC